MLKNCSLALVTSLLIALVMLPAKADDDAADGKQKKDGEIVQLPDQVVTSTARTNTTPGVSTSATLTATPLLETPVSIDVVPQQVIRDREPTTFYETLSYVSGTQTGGRTPMARTAGQVTLRGFSGSSVLFNNFTLPRFMPVYLDAVSIDHVDFVKGPLNAITGGQNNSLGPYGCGGTVNIVGKMPEEQAFRELSLGGSWNGGQAYRFSTDINQPVEQMNSLFRLNLAAESEQPFYLPSDIDPGLRLSLAPSWTWDVTDRLRLTFSANIQKQDAPAYQGIPYYQGEFVTDMDQYFGNDDSRVEYLGMLYQTQAEYDLSENLTLRAGLSYARVEMERTYWSVPSTAPRGSGLTNEQFFNNILATGESTLGYGWSDNTQENYGAFAHLIGNLETGPASHVWVVGVDWLRTESEMSSLSGSYTTATDLNDPDIYVPATLTARDSESQVNTLGLLVQDQIAIGNLRLLLGARYDDHENNNGDTADAISPRLGITYMVTPTTAVYGNYTDSEGPNFDYNDINGNPLTDPWTAEQMEFGIKQKVGNAMWASVAWFRIDQENMPEAGDSTRTWYELGGHNVSQGVEVSMAGNVTDAWFCQLSYTHIDYEDRDADTNYDRFPPHTVSLWQAYKLPSSILYGARLGLGYRFVDETVGTFKGAYIGEGYVFKKSHVVDVSAEVPLAAFGLENASLKLAVKNLFDEEYVESSRHVSEAFPGDPRTFELSFRTSF